MLQMMKKKAKKKNLQRLHIFLLEKTPFFNIYKPLKSRYLLFFCNYNFPTQKILSIEEIGGVILAIHTKNIKHRSNWRYNFDNPILIQVIKVSFHL